MPATPRPEAPNRPWPSDDGESCFVCGELDWRPLYGPLVSCESCSFVRAATVPSPEELARLYDDAYFCGEEYFDYLADRGAHDRNFARRLDWIERLGGKPRKLFEIGAAYGLFLRFASARGIAAAGVDVSEAAVAKAALPALRCGSFLELDLEPGDHDAFVLWDTVEHLARPDLFLARVSRLLPEGGWVYLTTGDIGSRNARRRREKWRMIHPPTHLSYFSRAAIARLLAACGLQLETARSMPIFRSFGATVDNLSVLDRGPAGLLARWVRPWMPGWLRRFGLWVDLGDIMFVAARKPSATASR